MKGSEVKVYEYYTDLDKYPSLEEFYSMPGEKATSLLKKMLNDYSLAQIKKHYKVSNTFLSSRFFPAFGLAFSKDQIDFEIPDLEPLQKMPNEEAKTIIEDLFKRGATVKNLMARWGYSDPMIYSILKKFGVSTKGTKRGNSTNKNQNKNPRGAAPKVEKNVDPKVDVKPQEVIEPQESQQPEIIESRSVQTTTAPVPSFTYYSPNAFPTTNVTPFPNNPTQVNIIKLETTRVESEDEYEESMVGVFPASRLEQRMLSLLADLVKGNKYRVNFNIQLVKDKGENK
jgi:hypothetical protein